jgi:plastocyanin
MTFTESWLSMRCVILAVLALAVTAALASAAWAATTDIRVGDNYFVRARGESRTTVSPGDTVRWVFAGRSLHNVTVKSGPTRFRSTTKSSGDRYEQKLTRPGTYVIFCSIHGEQDMAMTLRVT